MSIDRENERAVGAFLAISGGIEGILMAGGRMTDMAPLLDADEKTLRASGILDIADEMDRRSRGIYSTFKEATPPSGEPLISPDTARRWVLDTGKAKEIKGELMPDKGVAHICIAGITIATGDNPRYLSEVYKEATNHRAPLSDSVLFEIARSVADTYSLPDSDEPL